MNPSYKETFSRHPVLFSLPVIIVGFLALWFAATVPKEYKAGASIWVENSPTGASRSADMTGTPLSPAAQAQQMLFELMSTRAFRLDVARKGPLASYLERHQSQGSGPTGVLANLHGSSAVSDQITKALDSKHVLTTVPGPHVFGVEFHGPTPAVTVGTLKALLKAFDDQQNAFEVARQQRAMTRAQGQMEAASTAIAQPNSAPIRKLAETQLRNATRRYNQASLSLAGARNQTSSLQVMDRPTLPAPAIGGMKKGVFIVFAGILFGLLLSFFAVVLVTGQPRRDEETLYDADPRIDQDAVPFDVEIAKRKAQAERTAPAPPRAADRNG